MERCVIYARVSTHEQAENDSLKHQIERCRAYATARGYEIVSTLSDVESGSNNEREEYLILKDMIKESVFDVLVVWEFSRISRNAKEFITITEELQNQDIGLVCIQQNIDTSTITGKAVAHLIAVISELEKDTIRMRVKDRMIQLIKSGRYVSHQPFGYKYNNKLLELVEEEALIIKDIFSRFLKGESRFIIAKHYNVDFIKIDRWLRSPLYIGKLAYKGTGKNKLKDEYILYDGLHTPIIDEDTFYNVQAILNKNKRHRINNNPNYIFSGILYCECGDKMYGTKQRTTTYYICTKKRIESKKSCNSKTIKSEEIEKVVKEELRARLKNKDIAYQKNDKESEMKIKSNEKQIKEMESRINKAKDLYYANLLTLDDYSKDINKFNQSIEQLKKDISILEKKINKQYDSKKIKEIVMSKIDSIESDKIKFKKICNVAIDKIVIDKEGKIQVYFNF